MIDWIENEFKYIIALVVCAWWAFTIGLVIGAIWIRVI